MRNRKGKEIILIGNDKNIVFNSLRKASDFLGVSTTTTTRYIDKGIIKNGYTVDYLLEA